MSWLEKSRASISAAVWANSEELSVRSGAADRECPLDGKSERAAKVRTSAMFLIVTIRR